MDVNVHINPNLNSLRMGVETRWRYSKWPHKIQQYNQLRPISALLCVRDIDWIWLNRSLKNLFLQYSTMGYNHRLYIELYDYKRNVKFSTVFGHLPNGLIFQAEKLYLTTTNPAIKYPIITLFESEFRNLDI